MELHACSNCGIVLSIEEFSFKEMPKDEYDSEKVLLRDCKGKFGVGVKTHYDRSFICPVCKNIIRLDN
jgi:rubredoxin